MAEIRASRRLTSCSTVTVFPPLRGYKSARVPGVIRWSHMDELLSPILRFLGYVVSELLLGTFFYAIGWPFVKAVTLGKYPKREWLSGSKNEAYVCCVGIFVFSISLMAALGQLSA